MRMFFCLHSMPERKGELIAVIGRNGIGKEYSLKDTYRIAAAAWR